MRWKVHRICFLRIICEDGVHLNASGIAACAEQTARIIKEISGK